MEPMTTCLIDWGVAASSLEGEGASGDRYLVKSLPQGVLVAVVDGLGHGEAAAAAAALAIRTLDSHDDQSMIPHVKRCHECLRGTRGAVMSLASFSGRDSTMTWLAVGNVEGVLLRRPAKSHDDCESLLLRGGVVGAQLPPLNTAVTPVARGDILILATDGIRSGFVPTVVFTDPVQKIADRILTEHAKPTDDALVLVSRYVGEGVST
jgi:negative regulator of sigma-B (phosphoserine phosphatase)